MWSRSRNGSTMSRRGVGNGRRTTKPPPSTVRVAGTTCATARWVCVVGLMRGSRPTSRRVFRAAGALRGVGCERLHGAGEGVLPGPVPLEVVVAVAHRVGLPPVPVDRAGEDRGDDAAGVVLLALHA